MGGEHGALSRANAVAGADIAKPFRPQSLATNGSGVAGGAASAFGPADAALVFMRGPMHVSPAESVKAGTPAACTPPLMIPTATASLRRLAVR
jgi:hypothetical protein